MWSWCAATIRARHVMRCCSRSGRTSSPSRVPTTVRRSGMNDLLKSLGIEQPVLQAGMGSGLAGSALATAVSDAGGLGTIGILPPAALREEIASVRALTSKPVAVNLIVPFARRIHWEVASEADVVVT